uniref:NADH-ubiquinone oxidoreductase chain 6 n=1 Tax=Siren intermedia texana TaxID=1303107 RepID=A0A343A0H8_SIRIN|nr:NADH dehydrogenase subunit 6 [Siren intermedia texana]
MTSMLCLSVLGLFVGLIAVSANPSPYFAAFGLVLSAVSGCLMLVLLGVSFLSLVLMLVYLGGMLVVFAYSASLAADPYPKAWGDLSVVLYMIMYFLVFIFMYYLNYDFGVEVIFSWDLTCFLGVGNVWGGVGEMYLGGGLLLFIYGWILLLTLFVVLSIPLGLSLGSLRAV